MLTIHPRTHILELTKDREIRITEIQYKKLKQDQKLAWFNDALEIRDPDTWKILHDGLWKDFSWFREIHRQDSSGMNAVCDFWNRHSIFQECDCHIKYWFSHIKFQNIMIKMYPNKYPMTLTSEERNNILKKLSNP